MVDFLINNWFLLIIAIAIIAVIVYLVINFIKFPTDTKLNKVKEWLLYAVTEAEKELGSKTGAIKLRYVYNMFLSKFPSISAVITFDDFSGLVDDALAKFKTMLESNKQLQAYVEGDKTNNENNN